MSSISVLKESQGNNDFLQTQAMYKIILLCRGSLTVTFVHVGAVVSRIYEVVEWLLLM